MRLHLVVDRLTGEVKARGRSGRSYSEEDIDRAERRGDTTVLTDLDAGETAKLAPVPVISAEELDQAVAQALRSAPRWRRRKRR